MVKIATHNGAFHADDVFAVAMLLIYLGKNAEVVRTRNPEIIDSCDLVVDVGGVNNAHAGRFDHHQRGGGGERRNGVPYASAGLVWKAVAMEVCDSLEVAEHIDKMVVQKIDAADCGYSAAGLDRTYSALVSDFNPCWNESNDPKAFDEAFGRAVEFAKTALQNAIRQASNKEGAKESVLKLPVEDGLLILDEYIPWQDAVLEMPDVKAVVFPDLTESWKVQVAPVKYGIFDSRIKLPAAWCGAQFEELEKISGIPGAIFCHTALFIAGNKTRDGAIAMARKAIATAQ